MDYITVGCKFNEGKIAFIKAVSNSGLNNIDIKDKCFLLIILKSGTLEFNVGNVIISATAPSFLCFDETENPILLTKSKAHYISIYFHPKFLNINMSFEMLRSENYGDIATTHDMFMLKPFTKKAYVVPICDTQVQKIEQAADYMLQELEEQRDWYWSCRSRSYFMEIVIALERMYGLMGYGATHQKADNIPLIKNTKLRDAVLYIEGHYGKHLTLSDISVNSRINHTTLTALMKKEFGYTAMEYLMQYRVSVAKKQLAFTDVPIKDIANMVGFKTVQHFSRVFKTYTDKTPADFRKTVVEKRKKEL